MCTVGRAAHPLTERPRIQSTQSTHVGQSYTATTSMVVKNGTKKLFEGFLNILNVLNMSHGNGSSTFVFQVMGFLKPVTDSTDKGLRLSHLQMVGCHSLYGSNFYFCMTNFCCRHSRRKSALFRCKLLNKTQ